MHEELLESHGIEAGMHTTSNHGNMYVFNVDNKALAPLAALADKSSMFCHNLSLGDGALPDSTLQLILGGLKPQRRKRLGFTKMPQGFIITDLGNVAALVHAPAMYHPDLPNAQATILRVIHEEGNRCIRVIPHNNIVVGPHELSRCCTMPHAFQKLLMLAPLGAEPRQVFSNPHIGRLVGRMLKGDDANRIKEGFLTLAQAHGGGMYDTRIELPQSLRKLLMLQNAQGNVRVAPCGNGIVGYRVQPDGTKFFTFVASSNDFRFGHGAPHDDGPESNVLIHKMQYAEPGHTGARFVVASGDQLSRGDAPHYAIHISHTTPVQDILNQIAHTYQETGMIASGLQHYPLLADTYGHQ